MTPPSLKKKEHYAYDHVITHSWKVTLYSGTIAKAVPLPSKDSYELILASVFHDLDKLYWPLSLLDKPKNELSRTDWTRIMEHAVASAVFLERLTKHQIAQGVLTIIKQHHENLDGTGYPNNITGKEIGLGTRIIRVTDSYESMTSMRPYKKYVFNHEQALADLKHKVGGIYDSDIVKLFEETLTYEKILEINSDSK